MQNASEIQKSYLTMEINFIVLVWTGLKMVNSLSVLQLNELQVILSYFMDICILYIYNTYRLYFLIIFFLVTIDHVIITTSDDCNFEGNNQKSLSHTISLANGKNCTIPDRQGRNWNNVQNLSFKYLKSCAHDKFSFLSHETPKVLVKLEGDGVVDSDRFCSVDFEIFTNDGNTYKSSTMITIDRVVEALEISTNVIDGYGEDLSVVLTSKDGASCTTAEVQKEKSFNISGSDLGSCGRLEAELSKMQINTAGGNAKCFGDMEVKLSNGAPYVCSNSGLESKVDAIECTLIQRAIGNFLNSKFQNFKETFIELNC